MKTTTSLTIEKVDLRRFIKSKIEFEGITGEQVSNREYFAELLDLVEREK